MKNKNFYFSLFKKISLIRICENMIFKYYHENEMKTPMHMSRGEELVVGGAVEIFGNSSKYFGYYRSHALYLSLVHDAKAFFGEMYGKKLGENLGVTGSMHILSPKKNLMSVSAIVSSTIGPAIGHAYGKSLDKKKNMTISFFGDGATEQGVFHEALNFASLKNLPIAFICLNNNLAIDIEIKERQSYSISELVKSYGIKYFKISSPEIDNVCKVYFEAKKYLLTKKKPVFIEASYYRYLQHIGLQTDFEESKSKFEKTNYRSLSEYKFKLNKDPFILICNEMKKRYSKKFVDDFLRKKENEIEKIIKKIKISNSINPKNIFNKVFYEK